MTTAILLLTLLFAPAVARLLIRSRPAAMSPCPACGMAQAGVPRTADGRCATCQLREDLGNHTTQAMRAIRTRADAAVWRG